MAIQKRRMSLTKQADKLFSEAVRARGYCEMAELFPAIKCNGNLQCAHLVSRRYRAVRWFEPNALCACAAHHLYQTHHPLEFEAAIAAHRPLSSTYETLRFMALNNPPMNMAAVIERYRLADRGQA